MKTVRNTNIHYAFSPLITPAEYAEAGDLVLFESRDCYDEQITEDGMPFSELDMARNNPATGPLYVNGAKPGDILKVHIEKIELVDHGVMCVREGQGVYQIPGSHCRRFPIKDGYIAFDHGISLPVDPMIGVIGTSPEQGSVSTQSPGPHGGNLDINNLRAGSTVYLPVAVEGALLSMGDLHALQGDGETAICGMEASGNITVRIEVLPPNKAIPLPLLEDAGYFYTTAASESLDECSVAAARKMHSFLTSFTDLDDAGAAMLLSLCGNLRISQVVNPQKGCIMAFPKNILRIDFGGWNGDEVYLSGSRWVKNNVKTIVVQPPS